MPRRDRITPFVLVEAFVIANLGSLAGDVYIAHSVNAFERRAEWIPFFASLTAPVLLLAGAALGGRAWRGIGYLVAWSSIGVGVAGMLFHLQSHFFAEQTIRNLVYTAPFIAPLAYTGIGLLLILDRMVDAATTEWAQWVVFLALGGFGGNFVLSLADHAQNGFYNREEWIAVVAAALGVAFLLMMVLRPSDSTLLRSCVSVMLLEIVVGFAGFALHLRANLHQPAPNVWERFLYGAPIFAPLLFPNLAVLALIGIWGVNRSSLVVDR